MIKRHGHKNLWRYSLTWGGSGRPEAAGQTHVQTATIRGAQNGRSGPNPGQLPQFDRLLTEQYQSLMHQVRDELEHSEHEQYRAIATRVAALGEHSAAAMLADLGSPTFDHQISQLRHILSARRRIEQGIYGVCEICGAAIDLHWLRSTTAARCSGCETMHS